MAGELAQIMGEGRREGYRPTTTAEPLHRRSWTIRGQLEELGYIRELLSPILKLSLQPFAREPSPLPVGKVAVLDRQLRQHRRSVRDRRVVEDLHLPRQNLHRPTVGDRVVQRQQ